MCVRRQLHPACEMFCVCTLLGSRDWQRPPQPTRPEHTVALENGIACETNFLECKVEDCALEIMGAKVPLQCVGITVPAGTDIGGFTFVLRSQDNTRWYRDANGNFFVPLPTAAKPEVQEADGMARWVAGVVAAQEKHAVGLAAWFHQPIITA